MWFEDCRNWEYKGHPQINSVADECALILDELKAAPAVHLSLLDDTRPAHLRVFSKVVPVACPYFAGNYRGLVLGCLANYTVRVGHHLGEPPNSVHTKMTEMHSDIAVAIVTTDAASTNPRHQFLAKVVELCAATLERFLTIHPYANGNGHMARLLVWVMLMRYGFPPVRWTLDERPPGYEDLIQQYRDGNHKPLKVFIYKAIIGA